MSKHKQTAKLLRLVCIRASLFAVFGVLFLTSVFSYTRVEAATSSNLNYQARLLNANGSVVGDGWYNVRFKLYDQASGANAALWNETYYDANGATAGSDNRIKIVNGYLSANLGSQTAFPNINWDQDLWLTMEIGGSAQTATPTWDGEMNPRIKLTAVPYAFQAKQAASLAQVQGTNSGTLAFDTLTGNQNILLPDESGTVCLQNSVNCGFLTGAASDYIQNGTSLQTASNFHIQAEDNGTAGTIGGIIRGAAGGQTADLLQLQGSSGSVLAAFSASGRLVFGSDTELYRSDTNTLKTDDAFFVNTNSTSALKIEQTGVHGNVLVVDTANGRVGIGAVPSYKLHVFESSNTSTGSSATANISGMYDPAGNINVTSEFLRGVLGSATISASNASDLSTATVRGGDFAAYHKGFGNLNALTGTIGAARIDGAGTVEGGVGLQAYGSWLTGATGTFTSFNGVFSNFNMSEAPAGAIVDTYRGMYAAGVITSSGKTISSYYGLAAGQPQGDGTITNTYGLYVHNMTGSSVTHTNTPYGIYQAGSADRNFLSGNTAIGGSSRVPGATLDVGGTALVKTDSATALQIQNSSSHSLFTADTTNRRIILDDGQAALANLFVLDSSTAPPTGVNGGMYYDTTLLKFRCYQNGSWTDCIASGATTTLQDAYANSSSPATITTTATAKDIIFKSGVGFNSASLFQIQNASSQTLFVADTQNQRVAVGPAAVPGNGVLTVGTNTTTASGGLYFGTDTNLYRAAAGQLKSDGSIAASNGFFAGATGFGLAFSQWQSPTDTQPTFWINKDGVHSWGPGGSTAIDTNLYRSAASTLKTDDSFISASVLGANIGSANQVYVGATLAGTAGPGLLFGSAQDVNLYRSNTNELKTDDALVVTGLLTGQAGANISGGVANLNVSSNFATNINTGTSTGTVTIGNNTGNTNITIDSGTGAINIGTGSQSRPVNIATGVAAQSLTLGSTNSSSSTLIQGGTGNITILANGSANTGTIVRTSNNSSLTFQIQSAGSDRLFSADTANNRVYVGNATAVTNADSTLFVIDSASTANLPVGVNGGIVYDSTTNKFNIYEGGEYKELCNMTDLGCGAGATTTMQDVYNNSTSPVTVTTTATAKDIIFKSGVGFNSASLFQIQNASSQTLFVADTQNQRVAVGPAAAAANGVLTVGTDTIAASGGIYFGTDTNLYRSAANTLKTDDSFVVAASFTGQAGAAISGGIINLNSSSNFATNINTGTSTGAVSIGNNTGNTAITIDSGTSAINIGTGANARTVNLGTGAAAQILTMGSTSGASSTLIRGGTGNVTINASGTTNTGTIVKTGANSTNAFQIQNSAGTPDVLFRADSTNNRIYVGNATAASGADSTLLVIDSASSGNLPTGVNGGIIYDSTAGKFKIFENGIYKTLCNTSDLGCGAAGASQNLQDAYNNSGTPATITTSSATKGILFKSGGSFDSTSIFEIQSSGSDVLFRADTQNNRVYVGNATAGAAGDSTLLVIDSSTTTNLPVGVNGGIIYDSTAGKFKIYENGAYKTLCNTSDLGCGAAGVAQSLQDAYNNSSSPATITTTSNTKDLIIKSGLGLNSASVFQIQNASSQTVFVADTQNQRVAIGLAAVPGNGALTVGTDTTAASGGIYFGTDTMLYRAGASILRTNGNLGFGAGADRTFNVAGRATNAAGNSLTIAAGDAGTGASAFTGGTLILQGGNAAGTGNANGGNVLLTGGAGTGTGTKGLVVIDTPTFTTLTNSNCSVDCTISQSHIDNSGAVIVNATTNGLNITMPDPNNAVAGRIVYITAATGSNDFTLVINGGGVGNEISMRQNTSATMIWNGTDWTAAGASSSTTLQAAYNNTLTSAGAAEIILNNTATSDGFTIRNNMADPIMGSLFEVQSSIGTNLLSVNNRAVEYVANGGAETMGATSSTFPADTWSGAPTGGAVSRHTTLSHVATGQASLQVVTTASNQGVKNDLTENLATNTTYQVSFTGMLSSGTFTTLDTYYSRDGGSTLAPCLTSQSLVTTGWSKITCTFTTDGTAATDPVMIIRQSDSTGRTFWIDNLSVTLSTTVSTPPNVQIGGGIFGGTPTLLTLDRASSPPVANGNDVYYGSMYYDTTSGRIQCYEADGWGACGSAPDNFVNLVPEYAGAVLNGTGVGTMAADFCANSGALAVNSTLCSTGQALNFYKWTSPQATQQTYSIYVTYQLPAAFKHFANDNTVTLTARTDNVTNAQVTYQMYRSEGGTLTACGTETTVTTSTNTWQTVGINGNEYSGCGFSTSSANNNVIFKINVKAKSNSNAYVGTLSFTSIGQ